MNIIRRSSKNIRLKGFTLIELLITIIIVGILAAVAVPVIRGNIIKKAVFTEAVISMGVLAASQEMYYAEHKKYQEFDLSLSSSEDNPWPEGVVPEQLNGRYFSEHCYSGKAQVGLETDSFYIECTTDPEVNEALLENNVIRLVGLGYIYLIKTESIHGIFTWDIINSPYPNVPEELRGYLGCVVK